MTIVNSMIYKYIKLILFRFNINYRLTLKQSKITIQNTTKHFVVLFILLIFVVAN